MLYVLIAVNRFMCVAILSNVLVRISIKFRPQVPNGGSVDSNSPAGADGVRSTVHEDRQSRDSGVVTCVDKQCTLTPLAAMSSARCGLGTAVLNAQLVAIGKLSHSV